MLIVQILILGIIQGITEWLPVSSSGHLVLIQSLFELDVPIAFDVLLHAATLIVIIIHFRDDIWGIVKAFLAWQKGTEDFRLGLYIILATIPTGVVYLLFKDIIEMYFTNLLMLSLSFFITGWMLLSTRVMKGRRTSGMSLRKALLIGAMQGVAIMPGISRSGSTIATAILLRVNRKDAFKFSFLLAIPAISGALLIKSGELARAFQQIMLGGFIAAFIFGYISLVILERIVKKGNLHNFSYYCFLMAIITIAVRLFILK